MFSFKTEVLGKTAHLSSMNAFSHNNIQQIFTMAFGIGLNLPTLSTYSFNTFNTNTASPTKNLLDETNLALSLCPFTVFSSGD